MRREAEVPQRVELQGAPSFTPLLPARGACARAAHRRRSRPRAVMWSSPPAARPPCWSKWFGPGPLMRYLMRLADGGRTLGQPNFATSVLRILISVYSSI